MNARQKAKKYKRLYEELSKQPLPVIFKEPHQIDTLRYERVYPEELVATLMILTENKIPLPMKNVTDFISSTSVKSAASYIQSDIAQGLAADLDKYIVYRTDYDLEMNVYRVCGEIKVVNR